MDVRKVFNFITVIGIWLNLHPHYDFKKKKVTTCKFCKIGVILKLLCLLVAHVVSLAGRLQFWYRKSNIILDVLSYMLFIIEGSTTALVLWMSAFGDLKKWEKFLSIALKQTSHKNYWRFIILNFFGQCFPIVLIAMNGWLWTDTMGFDTYKYYLIRDAETYHNYVWCFFYINLAINIKNEFKEVNNLLVDITRGMKSDQVINNLQVRFTKRNHWRVEVISQLTKRYQTLYEATESVNNTVGWVILFFMAHTVFVLLYLLYTSIWLLHQDMFKDGDITALLCMNAAVAISRMVKLYYYL